MPRYSVHLHRKTHPGQSGHSMNTTAQSNRDVHFHGIFMAFSIFHIIRIDLPNSHCTQPSYAYILDEYEQLILPIIHGYTPGIRRLLILHPQSLY